MYDTIRGIKVYLVLKIRVIVSHSFAFTNLVIKIR